MANMPSHDEIQDAVRSRQDWGIGALQQLISIDSIAPNEQTCQYALAEIVRGEGLPAELLPLDNGTLRSTDGFIDSGLPLDNRPNLITFIGGGKGGRSLILNSHIDTVSWTETAHQWAVHPLSGTVKDGKLYGRGAMDAKGQVMAAVVALLALKDLGCEPVGKAILQSAVSEEPEGNGTLALCAQGSIADAAINLEATENHIAYGHRGIIGLRYTIVGETRHGSVRGDQPNVIVKAGQLAKALDNSLKGWHDPSDAAFGPPSVNIGRIWGGDDIYTTPHRCTVDCGIRYAPGTYPKILKYVSQALNRQLTAETPELPAVEDAQFLHVDGASIAPDSPFATSFLVLQPQLRRQNGQTATIVRLFGPELVLSSPVRPSQDKGGQGSELPQQAP
jgi:acetylornithine deacetylase